MDTYPTLYEPMYKRMGAKGFYEYAAKIRRPPKFKANRDAAEFYATAAVAANVLGNHHEARNFRTLVRKAHIDKKEKKYFLGRYTERLLLDGASGRTVRTHPLFRRVTYILQKSRQMTRF